MGFPTALLVQFSYGRAADKYGRRLVLRLANLGVTLSLSADAIILAFPDTFSIWLMVPASLFLLIGGGSTMVGAMVYTMVSDITPVADRASIFYLLMAFALILNAVLTPLSGLLMTRSIWLPAWLGLAACWAGTAVSYILPETSPILLAKAKGKLLTEEHEEEHGEATATNVEGGEEQARGDGITRTAGKGNGNGKGILSNAWFGFRSDFSNIYRFLISDGRIMVFTILTALHYPYLLGMSVFFYQFVSGHFALPWHQITYVATISRVTSVVVLLGILPIVSRLMSRFGGRVAEPLRRDMYLLRASAVLLCAGCLLLGLAPNKWFIMASQVVYGLSAGYTPLARALAISLVEPHMLATLNTALAALEAIMTVVAAPVLGWLIGVGDDLNGVLGGLAYIVLGALAFGGMMTTFCLRVPINKVEAGGA